MSFLSGRVTARQFATDPHPHEPRHCFGEQDIARLTEFAVGRQGPSDWVQVGWGDSSIPRVTSARYISLPPAANATAIRAGLDISRPRLNPPEFAGVACGLRGGRVPPATHE